MACRYSASAAFRSPNFFVGESQVVVQVGAFFWLVAQRFFVLRDGLAIATLVEQQVG